MTNKRQRLKPRFKFKLQQKKPVFEAKMLALLVQKSIVLTMYASKTLLNSTYPDYNYLLILVKSLHPAL
jgi:hypothetical protein